MDSSKHAASNSLLAADSELKQDPVKVKSSSSRCSQHSYRNISSEKYLSPRPSSSQVALISNRRKPFNATPDRSTQFYNPTNFLSTKRAAVDNEATGSTKHSFSREVINLNNENQIILTRKSTVDVSVVQPKRMRVDFPNSRSSINCIEDSNYSTCKSRESICSGHSRNIGLHSCSFKSRDTGKLQSITDVVATSTLPKEIELPPFTVSKIYSNHRILVPDTSLWRDFLEIQQDEVKLLNGIASFSGNHLTPTTLLETKEMIFIKYVRVSEEGDSKRNRSNEDVSVVNEMLFLPFKVFSSVVKWLFRIE